MWAAKLTVVWFLPSLLRSPVQPVPWCLSKRQLLCALAHPVSPLLACRTYAIASLEKSGFLMPKCYSLGFLCSDKEPLFYFSSVASSGHFRALNTSVSTLGLVFVSPGSFFFWHMWILFYIKWKGFLLLSDDGFKIKGASGFGVGVIQDYVVTEVYWLLVHFFLDLCKGETISNNFI